MQVINVPEEMIVRARTVLEYERAAQAVIKALTMEIVKNHGETVQLWHEVGEAAKAQGIVVAANETFTFDFISAKFLVTPKS